jgi:hypothetical protein
MCGTSVNTVAGLQPVRIVIRVLLRACEARPRPSRIFASANSRFYLFDAGTKQAVRDAVWLAVSRARKFGVVSAQRRGHWL